MSLDLNAATARLAREMGNSETAIADALVAATALLHSAALSGRAFEDAPVLRSQTALLHLNKMVCSLVEARGEAIRVHGQLIEIGKEMGATEVPWCPDKKASAADDRQAA
jgi:hypothetical protein